MAKGAGERTDVLQGTLDLMVLKTLETMGPLHGYGIARRIEQMSDDLLKMNEGTVYVGGTFRTIGGAARSGLAALDGEGAKGAVGMMA